MELLLTLTYVALCVAIFKIFRIPVNQWTLATAALGGVFGLALLFITMAYNHPFSTNARISLLACCGVITMRDLTFAFGMPGITFTKSITNSAKEWVMMARLA